MLYEILRNKSCMRELIEASTVVTAQSSVMGKVWLVTGASSGFGAELTKAIMAKGDQVAATFRQPGPAASFTRQYPGLGLGIVLDVTDSGQVQAAVAQAHQHFGRIDVLVKNAGYGTIGAIEELWME